MTNKYNLMSVTIVPDNIRAKIVSIDSPSQITLNTPIPTAGRKGLKFSSPFNYAYYVAGHMTAADRVTPGVYYVYASNNYGLFFKSVDYGATFTAVNTKPPDLTAPPWNISLGSQLHVKTAPGKAGHIYMMGLSGSFVRSMDGGVTWQKLTAISARANAVNEFGFGAPKPNGSGYPSIYIYATVRGVEGFYRSDDGDQNTPTWTYIGKNPLGSLDKLTDIDGDKNIWGQFYFAWSGSSVGYYRP